MNKSRFCVVFLLLGLLSVPSSAYAYMVGPILTLEQTEVQSDLVVKAQVISSHEAQDPWLGVTPGTTVEETRFRVISDIKGDPACPIIVFRYYKKASSDERFSMGPEPLYYNFEPGRAYLIFAKIAGEPCAYRQVWKYPAGFGSDQGILRCADALPLASRDLHRAVWHELPGLLKSTHSQDKLYALQALDHRSGSPQTFLATDEFDRDHVLAACAPLLHSSDPEVTEAALTLITGHSPYLRDEYGTNWSPPRYVSPEFVSSLPPSLAHIATTRAYSLQILSLANNSPEIDVRASAIRALNAFSLVDGGTLSDLQASRARWADDPQPKIRAAAALLLGRASAPAGHLLLGQLSRDSEPSVRMAVVRGIGLAKNSREISLLAGLLHDKNLDVREAAASNLASFPVAQTRSILQANMADPEFKSIFIVVLAEDNPTPYLDGLAEIVERQITPPQFSGNLPDYEAWDILFKVVSNQPQSSWTSDKWAHYLDVLETALAWDSSSPTDLYTFYVSHGLKDRAVRVRKSSKKLISWDMETTFNNIDADTPVIQQ